MFKHVSVLPNEVLRSFESLDRGDLVVDGTLGKGGHSKLLLERGFRVLGIDRDEEAIEEAKNNLKDFEGFKAVHGNFSDLRQILDKLNIEKVSGILVDLGVSTHQLECDKRGFGFVGKLDMRMDRKQKLTAEDVVNDYSLKDLEKVLKNYGERVYFREIARGIVDYREEKRIESGEELLEIVENSLPESFRRTRKHHWATPTFRALRIEVNSDLGHLEKFLDVFVTCLRKNGILSVITFHTMEDSIVRRKLRQLKQDGVIRLVTKKGIEAGKKEMILNPKSKRAKLWIAMMK